MNAIERAVHQFKGKAREGIAAALLLASSVAPEQKQENVDSAALDVLNTRGSTTLFVEHPNTLQPYGFPLESLQFQERESLLTLASIKEFSDEERNAISQLILERLDGNTQDGRFLIPFEITPGEPGVPQGFIPVSEGSSLARHVEQTYDLLLDLSAYGAQSRLIMAVERQGGEIHQASLLVDPVNTFTYGDVSFSQSNQNWIVREEDGSTRWFMNDNLPPGSYLDIISTDNIQPILEQLGQNRVEPGRLTPVVRDREGKVVRIFTQDAAYTFTRTVLTNPHGEAVNIRPTPAPRGEVVGRLSSNGIPSVLAVTPAEFDAFLAQHGEQSIGVNWANITYHDNRVNYNDGQYTWIAIYVDDQIRWVARFPQIIFESRVEGVAIEQPQALKAREIFSDDPNILARQLGLPQDRTYTFSENSVYGPIRMLRDETAEGTIWAAATISEEENLNWQTAQMIRDELGLQVIRERIAPGEPIEGNYFFWADQRNLFLRERRDERNQQGLSAIFYDGAWRSLQDFYLQIIQSRGNFRGFLVQQTGRISEIGMRVVSAEVINGLQLPLPNVPNVTITRMFRGYYLHNPRPDIAYYYDTQLPLETVLVVWEVQGEDDGQTYIAPFNDAGGESLSIGCSISGVVPVIPPSNPGKSIVGIYQVNNPKLYAGLRNPQTVSEVVNSQPIVMRLFGPFCSFHDISMPDWMTNSSR
jgi:hypothetical protein